MSDAAIAASDPDPGLVPNQGVAQLPSTPERIAFLASGAPDAQRALLTLTERYGRAPAEEAEVIVALGGDGFMLEVMHRHLGLDVPIFGMNCGTVGFLMNAYDEEDLPARLAAGHLQVLHPLRMVAVSDGASRLEGVAFNEVSLLRQERQAAKLRISINGRERMAELTCDGIILATAAGSTAYNLSAHGPIIPIGSPLMALTPISAFRPRRWRGALLPTTAEVHIEVLERWKRPVSAVADHNEARNVVEVSVSQDTTRVVRLLFDADHNLEERILTEQFGVA